MKLLKKILCLLVLSQTLSKAANYCTNVHGRLVLCATRPVFGQPPGPDTPSSTNPPPATSPGFTNVPGYAVFIHTNSLLTGMTVTVRWNTPHPFFSQNDELSLKRVEGTNLVQRQIKSILGNLEESFTINEPGAYVIDYVEVKLIVPFPVTKIVRARSELIFVSATTPPPPPLPQSDIAVFGDSFMQQMAGVLETRIGGRVHTFGVSGENTRQIRARLPQVLAVQPRIVVMDGGMMDAFDTFLRPATSRIAEAETLANLDFMFRELRARNIKVIFLGFAEHFIPTLRPKYAEVAARYDVIYIPDVFEGVFGNSEFMAHPVPIPLIDIHPNIAGYHRIIDRFIERLFAPEPARLALRDGGNGILLSWFGEKGALYTVQSTEGIRNPVWVDEIMLEGKATQTELVFSKARRPMRFFRLKLEP